MSIRGFLMIGVIISAWSGVFARATHLLVDFECEKSVEGERTFDPRKFRTFHSKPFGNDVADDVMADMVSGLGMYMGRSTNGPYEQGFPSYRSNPTDLQMKLAGRETIDKLLQHSSWVDFFHETDLIIVDSPVVIEELRGIDDFRRFAHYAAKYIKHFFSPDEGISCPYAVEGSNESMLRAKYWSPFNKREVYDKVTDFHREYCRIIREEFKDNDKCRPLCGGWAAGWVQFQFDSFRHYEDRLKNFINGTCGDIDFISLHMYDATKLAGFTDKVAGSGVAAVRDLVATETIARCGKELPLMVTEYNRGSNDVWYTAAHGYAKVAMPYCEPRDFALLHSVSTMFMQFLDRPGAILKAIPFFLAGAEDSYGNPLPWSLTRKIRSRNGQVTTVYTHNIKFYEMIYDLEGNYARAEIHSATVFSHLLVSETAAFLLLKNSDDTEHTVDLSYISGSFRIRDIEVRKLWLDHREQFRCAREQYVENGLPTLTKTTVSSLDRLDLRAEEFIVVKYTFAQAPIVCRSLKVGNHFSQDFMVPILAGESMLFRFSDVPEVESGTSRVRLSVGRGRGLMPATDCSVTVNGMMLEADMPEWTGGDLTDSWHQWAAFEYAFDSTLLRRETIVEVICKTTGGTLSTVSLQSSDLQLYQWLVKTDGQVPTPSKSRGKPSDAARDDDHDSAAEDDDDGEDDNSTDGADDVDGDDSADDDDEDDAGTDNGDRNGNHDDDKANNDDDDDDNTDNNGDSTDNDDDDDANIDIDDDHDDYTDKDDDDDDNTDKDDEDDDNTDNGDDDDDNTDNDDVDDDNADNDDYYDDDIDHGNGVWYSKNLIRNPAFESRDEFWIMRPGSLITKSRPEAGTYSVLLQNWTKMEQIVSVEEGAIYRLSAKVLVMNQGHRIDIGAATANASTIGAPHVSFYQKATPKADWRRKSLFFKAEMGQQLSIFARSRPPFEGTRAFVTNMSLRRVDPSRPRLHFAYPLRNYLPGRTTFELPMEAVSPNNYTFIHCHLWDVSTTVSQWMGRSQPTLIAEGYSTFSVAVSWIRTPLPEKFHDLRCSLRTDGAVIAFAQFSVRSPSMMRF